MQTIARLIRAVGLGASVIDRKLKWGARASMLRADIARTLASGGRAILVELADDLAVTFPRQRLLFIDHHGARAGAAQPSALRQVFRMLGGPSRPPWSRHFALVEANDVGHIVGLQAAGATDWEIRAIRAADRRAQGVSLETEIASRTAIAQAEQLDWLTIVRVAAVTSSAVTDFIDASFGGPGARDVLVQTTRSVLFFGRGDVVMQLAKLPKSWFGGALPERGYWGMSLEQAPGLREVAQRILHGRASRE